MSDEPVIGGSIRFRLDQGESDRLTQGIRGVRAEIDGLGKAAKETNETSLQSQKSLGGMVQSFQTSFTAIRNTVDDVVQPVRQLDMMLSNIIEKPAMAYAQTAGRMTELGRDYSNIQREMNQANFAYQEAMAEAHLPEMKAELERAKERTKFIKDNPELAQLGGKAEEIMGGFLDVAGPVIQILSAMSLIGKAGDAAGLGGLLAKAGTGIARLFGGGAAAGAVEGGVATVSIGTQITTALTPLLAPLGLLASGLLGGALGVAAVDKLSQGGANAAIDKTALGEAVQFESWEKTRVTIDYLWKSITMGSEAAALSAQQFGKEIGAISLSVDELRAAKEKGLAGDLNYVNSLKAYTTHRQTEVDQLEQFENSKKTIIEQSARSQVTMLENAEHQKQKSLESFIRQQDQQDEQWEKGLKKAYISFQKSLKESQDAHNEQELQGRKDFQEQLEKSDRSFQKQQVLAKEDHEGRLETLVENRDALGIVREKAAFAKQQERAQEAHDDQENMSKDDFAKRLAKADEQFEKDRAKRIQQNAELQAEQLKDHADLLTQQKKTFDLQQKEQQAQTDRSLAQAAKQLDISLKSQETQFDRQQEVQDRNFNRQLMDLGVFLGDENTIRQTWMTQVTADWQAFYLNLPTNPATAAQGRAGGGYMEREQLYRVAEKGQREFVLNQDTVQKLELSMGSLTQETFTQAGRGKQITLIQDFTFQGRLSQDERIWYKEVAYEQAVRAFSQAMED